MAITRRDSAFADCLPSATDLRTKLYFLATINSSSQIALCGADGLVAGVITEGANTGDGTTISRGPIEKVSAGAAITAGVRVKSDGNGQAIAGTTNSFGTARTAVSAINQLVEVTMDNT